MARRNQSTLPSALALAIIAVTCLLVGCGYDGSEPPYDCNSNPKGFPAAAVELLAGIEDGRLATMDQISGEFAELYTAHPGLLSDREWSGVVQRLGAHLRYRADRCVSDGPLQIAQAGEYYGMAAQIRPDDTLLQDRARLFDSWRTAAADTGFDITRFSADSDDAVTRTRQMRAVMEFALRGEYQFRFAREILAGAIFDRIARGNIRAGETDFTAADRALLAALGLLPDAPDTSVGSFRNPDIDIVAVRVSPVPPDSFCVELYFIPRHPIRSDLQISLWVETPDAMLPSDKQPRFPFDFAPAVPTSAWGTDRVALALRRIRFAYPISAVLVGLYETVGDRPKYLAVGGQTDVRLRIPVPASTSGL